MMPDDVEKHAEHKANLHKFNETIMLCNARQRAVPSHARMFWSEKSYDEMGTSRIATI
jgi:hypothetical protein